MNPLLQAKRLGQRLWLDNLSRELLAGPLQTLIAEDGLAGVTSNPAIFQKSISAGAGYADDLAALKAQPLSTEQRFEALAVPDVQAACDLFAASYQASEGLDGYVSLEVSPFLARDGAGTLAAAQRLWAAIDRPNAMIKIPATPESLPAFSAAIAAGINVNVTLMFGQRDCDAVFDAYLAGLRQRLAAGGDLRHVRSVASLFLSRVDTLVDARLEAIGADAVLLKGSAALAMAKLAYARWTARWNGDECADLRAAGANVQRLLWASTGTKNPAYPDTLYVDNLIGPDTVNTLPDATLAAFRDHGTASLALLEGVDAAETTLKRLAEIGIDLDAAAVQLQVDGLKLFDEAFEKLLASLA
ncbi:transaldolase [Chitinimonas koreensis]|uniref:transaldolase n=1 Tax=Chitinimonas koreensis TaxID=356302 RepID=UPI00048D86A9|nr:transaldolase [Chitinimonas koreensis]QNM96243.1 transaldolase [Chitinimonas koreensis]